MKKLTAGIFTALLGLVTVNAANAAIPSTSYVDTKIGAAETAAKNYAVAQDTALESAITTAYEAADATLKSAYEAADTALDGKITANTNEINGLKTSKQDALSAGSGLEILTKDGVLTIQTKGIATSESLTDLQGRMTTAEGEIDTLQSDLDTAEAAIVDNATAITLKADQTSLDATNQEVAKKADASTMTTELAKKVDIAQGTANQVMITNETGDVTTTAKIEMHS